MLVPWDEAVQQFVTAVALFTSGGVVGGFIGYLVGTARRRVNGEG